MTKVHTIILKGRIPSKKNNKRVIFNRKLKRTMVIPSKAYNEWHGEATDQVEKQFYAVSGVEEIQMAFWMPDHRRTDLTNKAESVMDLLVDCGVLDDDRWQVVPKLFLHAEGVDKHNPRVSIWIKHNQQEGEK